MLASSTFTQHRWGQTSRLVHHVTFKIRFKSFASAPKRQLRCRSSNGEESPSASLGKAAQEVDALIKHVKNGNTDYLLEYVPDDVLDGMIELNKRMGWVNIITLHAHTRADMQYRLHAQIPCNARLMCSDARGM